MSGGKGRHLLHLAALMLLLYFFALTAKVLGAMVAFAVFLPLGILAEVRFWWTLHAAAAAAKGDPPRA